MHENKKNKKTGQKMLEEGREHDSEVERMLNTSDDSSEDNLIAFLEEKAAPQDYIDEQVRILRQEQKVNRPLDEGEYQRRLEANTESRYTYDDLVQGLKGGKYRKIAVITGAGISVSAGIPDFRSPKTGLYSNLQKYDLPRPQAIFDIAYFREKPGAFYHLAREFLDLENFQPTPTHYFIRLLQDKGRLMLNMT
mmetsp:Transcript_14658/g.24973  ORF Transcript_14658/g.24973 Transcript_14658/m.24973 type:complete len:194 (+) Transcript_14658:55-636(+)